MASLAFEQFRDFRPTKGVWLGSCTACVVGTVLVCFTWGGLVTGGTAEAMANVSSKLARADLTAEICIYRFLEKPNVRSRLTALQESGKWIRDDLIRESGLVTVAGMSRPIEEAAALCADKLLDLDPAAFAPEPAEAVSTSPNRKQLR